MRRVTLCSLGVLIGCAVGALLPVSAAETSTGVPVQKIIDSFIDKETEFAKAREAYTYRQSVKILEYTNSGSVRGRWEVVQDILFGTQGKRIERVVYAPPSSLQNLILTPSDMEDLRSVQPFVMTRENSHEYRIDYLGEQLVDEIDTYMFSVKPKKLVKGKRYFEGQIWVDQLGLQIVKTYGKGVGVLGKNKDEQFPRFETYRDQIDGNYWFPVYTRADDTLQFRSGPQKIRMIIKYDDYKRFKGTAVITFGDVVEEDGESEPDQP
ncbi:MAG: hypothetical protein OXC19_24130 [Bryobacterales bacterium]|nr:hypothetical protein [Bryobacterales bacterium]